MFPQWLFNNNMIPKVKHFEIIFLFMICNISKFTKSLQTETIKIYFH